jgi:hypothetical protein
MTARRRRSKPKAAYWLDWSPAIAELVGPISILTGDLDAPKQVRVFNGLRHITIRAVFTSADGHHVTCKVRVQRKTA